MKDGGSAFPLVEPAAECSVHAGMTLRDYFAAQALQGRIAAVPPGYGLDIPGLAAFAYDCADAMLEARKPKEAANG